MEATLDDLDAAAVLAEMSGAVRVRRLAEVRDLQLLSHWAAIHSSDPTERPDGDLQRRRGNVLRQVGGEGTPQVQDFCLGEAALARGTGVTATVNKLADVLDLQHRLPQTWAVVCAGEAEVFIACRVARLSRHLPVRDIGVVDSAISRIIASEAGGRVLAVAEAKIIEANPALHDARVQDQQGRRFVGFGRTDEFGLRHVLARIEAGDAVWIKATLERVVEIIGPRHPGVGADELRSIAFGYLGRPAELLALLLEHTDDPAEPDSSEEPGTSDHRLNRALAFPADLLDALRAGGLARLTPKSVLYVHLHQAAVRSMSGVGRVEGLGPVSLAQLRRLLARTDVVIQPVIDLTDRLRGTAYEHPESLKERVHLLTGGDYWPFATSTSRRIDYDHPTPYDGHGPPGQTGTHNSGPLGRRHHRWKTHAGYRSRQAGAGRYVWVTPHGLGFLVDHRGTRRIPADQARMIIDAPPGVDIYPVGIS